MEKIEMVDLKNQYQKIKPEIDKAISEVINNAQFIGGPAVTSFTENLKEYLGCKHVVTCANGTDALQIAVMGLDLPPKSEIIVPAFTYVATAEVLALLGYIPVMVDVDPNTFCINPDLIRKKITSNTKAIVPVHLFGQSSPMEEILNIAKEFNLKVIEDNAQAIGAEYKGSDGIIKKTGTIGDIGCFSFFPSKNLGCYGDGGALCTNNTELFEKIKMIANHGQSQKYVHDRVGINSRLDSIQAAILDVKLKYLEDYNKHRVWAASLYTEQISKIDSLEFPTKSPYTSHVFHQYTIRVKNKKRNMLKAFLLDKNIPTMIYYPIPLNKQKAFSSFHQESTLPITDLLCQEVLSLPIHSELKEKELIYICNQINIFYK